MPEYRRLDAGDPAPWFRQRSSGRPVYVFDTAAGRYIVLCFYATAGDAQGRQMLKILQDERALFDDQNIAFFGVSVDPADEKNKRVMEILPGIRFFWDFDHQVSQLYGSSPVKLEPNAPIRRFWVVLNPALTVRAVIPATGSDGGRKAVADHLKALPPIDHYASAELFAPVIALDGVFEADLCARLVNYYETIGGQESGFMREVDGRTVAAYDHGHKRRSDCIIEDQPLKALLQQKIYRRIVPAVKNVHQFDVTRMERYIVACYDGETGGHFRPHRDNTTKGTAHRRFAVSINLNAEFDGGELNFPEYGLRRYKPSVGGAVIFSCSLLHMVTPVTKGRRYCFLPFLYDEAAAALREQNNQFLGEKVPAYQTGTT